MTVAVVDDRKEHNRLQITALARWVAAALVAPAAVVALLVLGITRNPVLMVLALVLVYGALVGVVLTRSRAFPDAALRQLAPAAADPTHHARFHNVTEGLCVLFGVSKPDLYVVPSDGCNACTIATGTRDDQHVALVLTSGLLDALSRIELEGILSQQLCHVRDGDTALGTLVAAFASLPVMGAVVASRARACLDPDLEQHADLGGTSVTRYPPGLASALERIEQHSTAVEGVAPLAAHLWLADPLPVAVRDEGHEPSSNEPLIPHPPLADRIALLREL